MMIPRNQRLLRIGVTLFLLLALGAILACGGSEAPAQESAAAPAAATAAPASGSASGSATATPAPTPEPAGAAAEIPLHLAVTPFPQDTYLPWLATSGGQLPMRPMWENLTTIDPKTGVTTIYPQLARDWEISADAKEYTFYLQEGVQFHFGWGDFTVKDVILTIDQQTSDPLAGCKAAITRFMGADSMSEMVENGDMDVIDDYTFTMRLAEPQVDVASWWFNILVIPCAAVRSSAQHAAEGDAMFENGPAGTGAYQFVSRTLKETAEFEAAPYDHWRVNPEFKTLKITTSPEDLTRLGHAAHRRGQHGGRAQGAPRAGHRRRHGGL